MHYWRKDSFEKRDSLQPRFAAIPGLAGYAAPLADSPVPDGS